MTSLLKFKLRRKINFFKKCKKLNFEKILILEGYVYLYGLLISRKESQ